MKAILDLNIDNTDLIYLLSLLFIREPLLFLKNLRNYISDKNTSLNDIFSLFIAIKEAFGILNSYENSNLIDNKTDDLNMKEPNSSKFLSAYKGKISKSISYETARKRFVKRNEKI